ncbi:hypothetical protein HBI56_094720 [Parastagonospora nodorum]|uniref:Uncharacterized protein n=1 Tax=Phaeosphaeria nodorum (strain SN15 / ATCC MYA-4574 / FGSC 10173) TaxID=321614 RepID=A0A7U2F3T7_PHANO|nr:hypothetical protein HBH56_090010 [Parastagonospora nodorum]QRC98186.1 hypothetical protein JI435_042800 [Parastagonospora nodorum SN15]KAH3936169.1 hypothetical protein HBH54_024650 [Parastagonospora nodorum]KAH3945742.1 hypothetical protein HBH53_141750 [Parastagonospora nodorum]KAH3966314.1 hypothetical protein HBH51_143620 [Parastagonospora nodorum]
MALSKHKASALFQSYNQPQPYSYGLNVWNKFEDYGSLGFAAWPTLPPRLSPHDASTLSLSNFSRIWTLPHGPKASEDTYAASFQKLVNALFNNLRYNVKVSHSAFRVFKSKAQQLKDKYQRMFENFESHRERGELFYDDMDNPHIGQYRMYEQILRLFENVPPLDRVKTYGKRIGRILTLLKNLDQRQKQQLLSMETWSSAVFANCRVEMRLTLFAEASQRRTLIVTTEHGRDDTATSYYDAKEVQEGQNDSDVSGQLSLKLWRRSAGRSKSWRRCPKTRLAGSERHVKILQPSHHDGYQFFQSPLWIPSAYIRSRGLERSTKLARYVQRHESRGQTEHQDVDIDHDINVLDVDEVAHGSHSPPASDLNCEDDQSSDIDLFLRGELISRRGWHVCHKLRRDVHADVYLLRPTTDHDGRPEAHVFHEALCAKSQKYQQQKKKRLIDSKDYLDSFWLDDRNIVVMDFPGLRLQDSGEFPALFVRKGWSNKAGRRQHGNGKMITYASVLKGTPVKRNTAEELLRTKKRVKQKEKRQSQRDSRRSLALLDEMPMDVSEL